MRASNSGTAPLKWYVELYEVQHWYHENMINFNVSVKKKTDYTGHALGFQYSLFVSFGNKTLYQLIVLWKIQSKAIKVPEHCGNVSFWFSKRSLTDLLVSVWFSRKVFFYVNTFKTFAFCWESSPNVPITFK